MNFPRRHNRFRRSCRRWRQAFAFRQRKSRVRRRRTRSAQRLRLLHRAFAATASPGFATAFPGAASSPHSPQKSPRRRTSARLRFIVHHVANTAVLKHHPLIRHHAIHARPHLLAHRNVRARCRRGSPRKCRPDRSTGCEHPPAPDRKAECADPASAPRQNFFQLCNEPQSRHDPAPPTSGLFASAALYCCERCTFGRGAQIQLPPRVRWIGSVTFPAVTVLPLPSRRAVSPQRNRARHANFFCRCRHVDVPNRLLRNRRRAARLRRGCLRPRRSAASASIIRVSAHESWTQTNHPSLQLQEIGEQPLAVIRQHALRMKLHPFNRENCGAAPP